jgi:hypothetical protein
LRATLVANGITREMPLIDALDVAEVLVKTGRAIPPGEWVDDYVEQQKVAKSAKMLRSLV